MMDKPLTYEEAYKAMFVFLEHMYKTTKSADIGSLLGDMSMLADGMPADNAVWPRWTEAIDQAIAGVDIDLKIIPPEGDGNKSQER